MNTPQYMLPQDLSFVATFTDDAGELVDPTTVRFRAIAPNRSVSDYVYETDAAVEKTGTGVYKCKISFAANADAGAWTVIPEGTGNVNTTPRPVLGNVLKVEMLPNPAYS